MFPSGFAPVDLAIYVFGDALPTIAGIAALGFGIAVAERASGRALLGLGIAAWSLAFSAGYLGGYRATMYDLAAMPVRAAIHQVMEYRAAYSVAIEAPQ